MNSAYDVAIRSDFRCEAKGEKEYMMSSSERHSEIIAEMSISEQSKEETMLSILFF